MADDPEFYFDPERGCVMFACPHQDRFTTLPDAVWRVDSIDPLTVWPAVRNPVCGCDGWIRAGRWHPRNQPPGDSDE